MSKIINLNYFYFVVYEKIFAKIYSGELLIASKADPIDDSTKAGLALMKLMVDCKRNRLTERDFVNEVTSQTGLPANSIQKLWAFMSKDSSLDDLISTEEYRFRDLEWRLEAKVASRFLHSQPPNPKIALKVHLDKEKSLSHRLVLTDTEADSSKKVLVMQTSPNNLAHIIEQLESAKTAVKVRKVTDVQK